MQNIIEMCGNFVNKYNKFINITNIDVNYSEKLKNLEFEISDSIESIYYDDIGNKVVVGSKFLDNKDAEFYFSKIILEVLSTKKENNVTYKGIAFSNDSLSKNIIFNDMIQNYICNSIIGKDINDISRVFMTKVEKIIDPNELVRIYFNNDIASIMSYFESYGINFDTLSSSLDSLYVNNLKQISINSTVGTDIDKMLIDAYVNKSVKENNTVDDYSNIAITNGLVNDYIGFKNISENEVYYYNTVKNKLKNSIGKSY